jgi:hypothetical protein
MVPENNQKQQIQKINFIGLQNNRHPSQHTGGNFHKAYGNWQQRPLRNQSQEGCHTFFRFPTRLRNVRLT